MKADEKLDLCGVTAPYCLLECMSALATLAPGAILEIQLRDPETANDLLTIFERSGETVVREARELDRVRLWVRKNEPADSSYTPISKGPQGG